MKHYNHNLLAQINALDLPTQPVTAEEFDRVMAITAAQMNTTYIARTNQPKQEACNRSSAQKAHTGHAAHTTAPHKLPFLLRAVCGAAISTAACCVLLIGTNFVNPVFAESLPLVGTIFAYFNGLSEGFTPPYLNDEVASMATDVIANSSVASDADSESAHTETNSAGHVVMRQPLADVTIEQAVCDGMTLQLSLRMTLHDTDLANAKLIWSLDTFEDAPGRSPLPTV